jgi:hypothetical protein
VLGHKTLAMTVRYLHVNEDSQKAAVARLGDSIVAEQYPSQGDTA